ncbi:hypothetical protein ECZU03_36980 [Escherichia coli]|nr:hypothetical protein ECZU03_36980 [Escherichia coli]
MSLSRKPEVTWYGWDGDHLTTVQTDSTYPDGIRAGKLHTAHPHRNDNGERGKTQRRSWRRSSSRKGAGTDTAWCSRLNWYGCWTDWRKSGQTA